MLAGSVGSPYAIAGHHLTGQVDDIVVLRARHDEPRRDRAALAAVRGRRERAHHRRLLRVGVVQHDGRRLAAELEEDPLQRRARRGHDRAADRGGAGEGDDVDVGVRRHLDADLVVGRGQNVDDAGREVGVLGDQLAQRERRPRRVRRALEHDRAAGGERRAELRERQLDRVVVGDDGADDAGRFLLDPAVADHAERLAIAEILGELVGFQQVGVVADDVDRHLELRAAGARDGRAHLVHQDRPQVLDVVLQRLVQLVQAARAELGVARPVRGVERAPRRSDRPLDVTDARVGRGAQHLFGRRRDVLVRLAVLRRDELAVDQQPFLMPQTLGCGHSCAPFPYSNAPTGIDLT